MLINDQIRPRIGFKKAFKNSLMAFKGGGDPKPLKQPSSAQPQQQPERTLINGRETSSRIKGKDGVWANTITMDPNEQAAMEFAQSQLPGLVRNARDASAVTDNERVAFRDQLYNPQKQRIENEYEQVMGAAVNQAGARGTLNSLGFQNYRTNQLEKNKMEQLNNVFNSADMNSYNLSSMKMQPIQQLMAMYSGNIQQPISNSMTQFQPTANGAQMSNSFELQRAQLAQQWALANRTAPSSGGGFFGSMF